MYTIIISLVMIKNKGGNMSRLDQFYGQIPGQSSMDSFAICPLLFTQGKTQQELLSMQQIYKKAYEKALNDFNKNDLNNFDFGAGI